MNLAVFSSGRGSNFEAILKSIKSGCLNAKVVLLVTDNPDCGAVKIAYANHVPVHIVSKKRGQSKEEQADQLSDHLRTTYHVRMVVLAGYMKILSGNFVEDWYGKIVNIHPSLLPSFPGLNPHKQALEAGVAVSGCTVHYVDKGVDTGPIILQKTVPVYSSDTEDSLAARILAEEHKAYPEALKRIISGEYRLEGRSVIRREVETRRAFISVSDKDGLDLFVGSLIRDGYEIVSTGGTAKYLREHGRNVTEVSEVTEFPEILGGRVKSLHPNIFGGILARKDDPGDRNELLLHKIYPFNLIVVNFYDFEKAYKGRPADNDLIEFIDIGGPALVRAAAKNFRHVTVLTSPRDYNDFLYPGKASAESFRRQMAIKAFRMTSSYDNFIAAALISGESNQSFSLSFGLHQELEHGENKFQKASFYSDGTGLSKSKLLAGNALGYVDWLNADSAMSALVPFKSPCAVAVIKNGVVCGLAVGDSHVWDESLLPTHSRAMSATGNTLAINCNFTKELAEETFHRYEMVIAPYFNQDALVILKQNKNLKILEASPGKQPRSIRSISGGILVQEGEDDEYSSFKEISKRKSEREDDMVFWFAWRACRSLKSYGIVLAKPEGNFSAWAVGIGYGMANQRDSLEMAIRNAGDVAEGSTLASDWPLPLHLIEIAAKHGIVGIIQPEGPFDSESVRFADYHNMILVTAGPTQLKL